MTSVAIPLAMATVGGFMVLRALHNLYTGQGTCLRVIDLDLSLILQQDHTTESSSYVFKWLRHLFTAGKGDQ